MAGKDNLRTPSTEEARAMQLLSAKKRSENVKAKKIFKEELEKRLGVKDFEEIIDNLILRAKKDDKSFEVLRDTMGQKPSDKIEANFTYEDTLKKVVDDNDY